MLLRVALALPRLVLAVAGLVVAAGHGAMAQTAKGPALVPTSGELVLHKWSGEVNIPDPVACTVDPHGRVYVTSTSRRGRADLDIKEHPMWVADDVGLTSVAEKTSFLHRVLAPGIQRHPRGMLNDHNGDGSIDWRDLTTRTERIYQLRDTDADGTADKITVFAEGFNTEVTGIAAGVLYHDGWVYATIVPDLWRFKDTDDDGVADIREVLAHGFGVHIAYNGHDMHGLTVGPDGRIYWSIGDKGVNVNSKEGRRFFYPNEGCILRMEPDGSNFDVYARGVRNVQEPAFDAFGDMIAVDNDADQPGERERFVYLMEGSDSGWRINFQFMQESSPWMRDGLWKPHFPGQAAYLLPPLASFSDGPAGFKHDPGTALSERQRGVFLLNEFPSGRMRAFHVEPVGASFKMVDERVVNSGIMGVGMTWHPDGSLLMVDWMGRYELKQRGAVWRIDAHGAEENSERAETRRLLAAGFGGSSDVTLTTQLGHRDQRVRQGAQLELAQRGRRDEFLRVARDIKGPQLARIHALWGYGQLLRRGAADVAAVLALLDDADAEIRRQTAKILGDAASAKGVAKSMVPLLADPSPRVRVQAAIALGKHAEPAAVDALFATAAIDGEIPVLRHAVVIALAGCALPEQLAEKTSDASPRVRLVSALALRRQASPELADFLRDRNPLIVAEAARGIHDDGSIPPALPSLAALLEAAPPSEAILRRAINANLREGTPEGAARLLAFALDGAALREMREEALVSLRLWKEPPPLDRIDGWARTFTPADITAVLAAKLDRLLTLSDPRLKTLAVEIMIAHDLKADPVQIEEIVRDSRSPGELRAESLRLLAREPQRGPHFRRALDLALAEDAPAPLYRAGLELLLPDDTARLVAGAKATLERRSMAEKQHALALLAKAAAPAADAVLTTMADALLAGRCEPELKLDVMEAVQARAGANMELARKWDRISAELSPARTELLAGGNISGGREIVAGHLAANCVACHSIESYGGSTVGPSLWAIGSQRDPAYLLESLLNPSAVVATGYGIVNVTLTNGVEVSGTLAKESAEAVTVRLFDGQQRTIARAEIARQTPVVSIMPPMAGVLHPREIRDVVSYLKSMEGRRPVKRKTETAK